LGPIMQRESGEVMLAQEQGVIMKGIGLEKELEGGFGEELGGTLVLTNRRLIFVSSNDKEDELPVPDILPGLKTDVLYSDVEELDSIPTDSCNLFISIPSISSVHGHRMELTRPSLEVKWREGSEEKSKVFVETVTGRSRKKNLNDWASVIERLNAGLQKLTSVPKNPSVDTLEGKIMKIMNDMQWRGLLGIEEEVEETFKTQLDPDEIQTACDKLSSQGSLRRRPEPGDVFYRKCSPLGDDDLSD